MSGISDAASTASSETSAGVLETAENILQRMSDADDEHSSSTTPITTRKTKKKKKGKKKTRRTRDETTPPITSRRTHRTHRHRRSISLDSNSSAHIRFAPPPPKKKKTMAEVLKALDARQKAATSAAASHSGETDLEMGSVIVPEADLKDIRAAQGLNQLLTGKALTKNECNAILSKDELRAATLGVLTRDDSESTGDIKNPAASTGAQATIGGLLLTGYQQLQEHLNPEENVWKTFGFAIGVFLIFVGFSLALSFWNHRRIKRLNKNTAAKEVLSGGIEKELIQNSGLNAATHQELLNFLATIAPSRKDPTRAQKLKAKIPTKPSWLSNPF